MVNCTSVIKEEMKTLLGYLTSFSSLKMPIYFLFPSRYNYREIAKTKRNELSNLGFIVFYNLDYEHEVIEKDGSQYYRKIEAKFKNIS